MPPLIHEVDRLIGRLETLQRQHQPAIDRLTHRRNGSRGGSSPHQTGPGGDRRVRPCYRQKTFWAGMVLVATGLAGLSQGEDQTASIAHVAEGLGLITLRRAIADLEC